MPKSSFKRRNVLMVDVDGLFFRQMAPVLEESGLIVEYERNPELAVRVVKRFEPATVICSYPLSSHGHGQDFAHWVEKLRAIGVKDFVVISNTALNSRNLRELRELLKVAYVFEKPVSSTSLLNSVMSLVGDLQVDDGHDTPLAENSDFAYDSEETTETQEETLLDLPSAPVPVSAYSPPVLQAQSVPAVMESQRVIVTAPPEKAPARPPGDGVLDEEFGEDFSILSAPVLRAVILSPSESPAIAGDLRTLIPVLEISIVRSLDAAIAACCAASGSLLFVALESEEDENRRLIDQVHQSVSLIEGADSDIGIIFYSESLPLKTRIIISHRRGAYALSLDSLAERGASISGFLRALIGRTPKDRLLPSVLIADSDISAADELVRAFSEPSCMVSSASTLCEALEVLKQSTFEILILAEKFDDGSGLDFLRALRSSLEYRNLFVAIALLDTDDLSLSAAQCAGCDLVLSSASPTANKLELVARAYRARALSIKAIVPSIEAGESASASSSLPLSPAGQRALASAMERAVKLQLPLAACRLSVSGDVSARSVVRILKDVILDSALSLFEEPTVNEGERGDFIITLLGVSRANSHTLIERLCERLHDGYGSPARFAINAYPDDALTPAELMRL